MRRAPVEILKAAGGKRAHTRTHAPLPCPHNEHRRTLSAVGLDTRVDFGMIMFGLKIGLECLPFPSSCLYARHLRCTLSLSVSTSPVLAKFTSFIESLFNTFKLTFFICFIFTLTCISRNKHRFRCKLLQGLFHSI